MPMNSLRALAAAAASLFAVASSPAQAPRAPASDLEWKFVAGSATAPRAAVVIAVGEYRKRPAWKLQSARQTALLMRETFSKWTGVPESAVKTLLDQDVYPQKVRATIEEAVAAIAPGDAPLLNIYWFGHGAGDGNRAQHLLTYHSDRVGAKFDETIPALDLAEWAHAACRAHAERLGRVPEVALWLDCCRTDGSTLAPSEDWRTESTRSEWRIYSTKEGQAAEAGTAHSGSPFAQSLAAALSSLASQNQADANLRQVFDALSNELRILTGRKQEAKFESAGPKAVPPPLLRAASLSFSASLVDAIDNKTIVGVLQVDDRRSDSKNGELQMTVSPGKRKFTTTAPGYLTRVEDVDLGTKHAGATVVIPLRRQLTVVKGKIEGWRPGVSLRVRADVARSAIDSRYYVLEATPNSAQFELRVPDLKIPLEILVGGNPVQDVRLDGVVTTAEATEPRHHGARSAEVSFSLSEQAVAALAKLDAKAGAEVKTSSGATPNKVGAAASPVGASAKPVPSKEPVAEVRPPAARPDADVLSALAEARQARDRAKCQQLARQMIKDHPEHPLGHLVLGEVLASAAQEAKSMVSSATSSLRKFQQLARKLTGDSAAELGQDLRRAGFQGNEAQVDKLTRQVDQWVADLGKDAWLMRLHDGAFVEKVVAQNQEWLTKAESELNAAQADLTSGTADKERAEKELRDLQRTPIRGRGTHFPQEEQALLTRIRIAKGKISRATLNIDKQTKEIQRLRARLAHFRQ